MQVYYYVIGLYCCDMGYNIMLLGYIVLIWGYNIMVWGYIIMTWGYIIVASLSCGLTAVSRAQLRFFHPFI